MTNLFTDPYFWMGFVLFIASTVGVFWILKSFQKNSHLKNQKEPISAQFDFEKTLPSFSVPKESLEVMTAPTIETLYKQMRQIEETLAKITSSGTKPDLNINSPANSQLDQISSKVDKIYNILTSLSKTEEK